MGPLGSARRICADEAMPPRNSSSAIAEAVDLDSRHRRKAMWIGNLFESVGLARMAFRFVPTDEELKPILPTIPAYVPWSAQHFSLSTLSPGNRTSKEKS